MKAPYFSIVIPTKNRSFLIGKAIECVRRQSFPDWELVVADNNEDQDTSKIVEQFDDSRIRLHRTGGLNMPDNWDAALRQATGEYVLLLEDKQLLKAFALDKVHRVTSATRPDCVSWPYDVLDDGRQPPAAKRVVSRQGVCEYSPDQLIATYISGADQAWTFVFPRGANSAIHRRLVNAILTGPFERLCLPTSPDTTLGWQILAIAQTLVHINQSLVVIAGMRHSNGRSVQRGDAKGGDYIKSVGGLQTGCSHVPIKAILSSVSKTNDFCRVQQAWGGRLKNHPIDMARLFLSARQEICLKEKNGMNMAAERTAWGEALARQNPALIAAITRCPDSSPTLVESGTKVDYFTHQVSSRLFTSTTTYLKFDRLLAMWLDPLLNSWFQCRRKWRKS